MKGENLSSMSAIMRLTSLLIRMKTSLDGLVFNMSAFRYALPMSRVVTSLPSLAAICVIIKMDVVLMVGEEVSAVVY